MRHNILNTLLVIALFIGGTVKAVAQERPKLREISDKKLEVAMQGVVPMEKKGECGYADAQGKFIIPPIFNKVMPMSDRNVGFVCFLDETGNEYWTPISIQGIYLSDQNFNQVIKDFDERGLAVVRQGNKYGIINHTGKMVAGCSFQHFEDKGPVYLLYTTGGGCVAVAKDKSEKGYTAYSFAAKEPIIVKTEGGYGIITQKNYFTVADFIYDSVKELVSWEVYSLQKGSKKYLYAADKLSMGYDNIIPGLGATYFVVQHNGKYGILTSKNEVLLSCSQDEIPVLQKSGYTCLYENGSPVYLTPKKRVSASEYDDYLYFEKHKGAPAEYLLDETLAFESKKNVRASLAACYGTRNFDLVKHLDAAVEYAESRKLILLSKNNENAMFLDLETGQLIDAGAVLYHAFPSKTGAPAYASTLKDGKFGILDIRTKEVQLPFEYDRIVPLKNGYVCLQLENSFHLYNVPEGLMITSHSCESIEDYWLYLNFVIVKQDGKQRVYSLTQHKWILPEDHVLDSFVRIPNMESLNRNMVAVMKKTGKKAMFSLHTGDRLTDYLFDDVVDTLFAEKYNPVQIAGKSGLYDVANKKYVLPCDYNDISGYCVFDGDEYVVVTNVGKKGVYNLTDKKLVVAIQNDDIDMRGGYVRIRRGQKYAVYSLRYNKMVFESPVDKVELMNDGYAILKVAGAEMTGVYDLNWNEWHIDPEDSYYSWYWSGDCVCLGNNEIVNYKTKELVFSCYDHENIIYFDSDYVISRGNCCGEPTSVYKYDGSTLPMFCVEHVIKNEEAPLLGRDIALLYRRMHDGDDGYIGNIIETYIGVYDIDHNRYILEYEYKGDADIRYDDIVNQGLINIEFKNGENRLYDIVKEKWLFSVQGEIRIEHLKGNYPDEFSNYWYITLPDGTTYLFDPYDRVITQLKENFGVRDYNILKSTKSTLPKSVTSGYDRVSPMHQ